MKLKDITLIAVAACCLLQAGAQLFAVSVVASTLSKAPPRSLFILQGEYGYNSSSFWEIVPTLTFALLLIALITNWKTQRKKLILSALALFIIAGLVSGFLVEPLFADIIKIGYSDNVDKTLLAQARSWYIFDWMVLLLSFIPGLILLVALSRPLKILTNTTTKDSNS